MKQILNILLPIFFYFICINVTIAQFENLGSVIIDHFDKKTYKAGTQNWDLHYAENDILIAANNEGVLIYDGSSWQVIPTPNMTIVRSIEYDPKLKRIYVGAQSEFGYIEWKNNKYNYVDLTNLLKTQNELNDIWDIEMIGETIYFRADNQVFVYRENSLESINPNAIITFISAANGELYFNELDKGLARVTEDSYEHILGTEQLATIEVLDVLAFTNDTLLIFTLKNGIYSLVNNKLEQWKTEEDRFLINNWINDAYLDYENGELYIATYSAGIVILNFNGQLIRKIDKSSGLQNNTVTDITGDGHGNIWLSNYSGIDKVYVRGNFKVIYPDRDNKKAVYDIEIWNDHLFFATSNGLYYAPFDNNHSKLEFQQIENSVGECWGLDKVDGKLFLAHNNGGFEITPDFKAQPLDHDPGVWKFIKIGSEMILLGQYFGLSILNQDEGEWKFSHKIKDFEESSRLIVKLSEEELWITHPYKGLYQVTTSDQFRSADVIKVDTSQGIDNLIRCYAHEINNNLIVSNEEAIFAYDGAKFIKDERLNDVFQDEVLLRLLKYNSEYWYITNTGAGRLLQKEIGASTQYSKEEFIQNNSTFVGGFEHMMVLEDETILVCTDEGVKVFHTNVKNQPPVVNIGELRSTQFDTVFYNRIGNITDEITIPFKMNNIQISFNSNMSVYKQDQLQYSYRLNEKDTWSEWSYEPFKTFEYLPYGDYEFQVKARANNSLVGEPAMLSFTIKPPIYLSFWAKVLYLLLFLFVMFIITSIPYNRQRKRNRILTIEKNLADTKSKALEEENYQVQIEAKNNELATTTMHLVQKNQILNKVKDEIINLRQGAQDRAIKSQLKSIINLLNEDDRLEEDWENFSKHFNEVHHDFLNRLKQDFPDLSPNDLKLCAYLRLNLTTKEIAPLMGISVRGVEVSRYRLRKKIDLDRGINLNEFMIQY